MLGKDTWFREFYRVGVTVDPLARVSSRRLREAYMAWAKAHGAGAISFPDQRRAMEAMGHGYVRCNGSHYQGAALVDVFDLPAPVDAQAALQRDRLAARIDAVMAELTALRAALGGGAGAIERAAPELSGQPSGPLSGRGDDDGRARGDAPPSPGADGRPDGLPDSWPDG